MPLARPLVAHGRLRGYGHVHGNGERVRSLWEAFFALAAPRNVTMGDHERIVELAHNAMDERDAAVARAERAEAERAMYRQALDEIAGQDFRGPEPTERRIARLALAAVREHTDSKEQR